jgi:hypothetical protein
MAAHHVGEGEPGGSAEHLGLLSSSGSGVGLMASLTANTSQAQRRRTLVTLPNPPLPRLPIQSKSDASTSGGGGALVAVISHGEAETMGKPGEIEQTMGQGARRREC